MANIEALQIVFSEIISALQIIFSEIIKESSEERIKMIKCFISSLKSPLRRPSASFYNIFSNTGKLITRANTKA